MTGGAGIAFRRGLAAWRRVGVLRPAAAEHVFAQLPWAGVPTVGAPSGRSFAASGYLAGSLRGARGDLIRVDAARKPRASSSSARRQRAVPAVEETEAFDDAVFDREFWISQVTGPSVKQSARLMVQRVNFSDPLGVDTSLRGASKGTGKAGGRKTLYDYALEVKAQHPRKVLLIRVGEFYEALGYDAVMLVMHAGLNPMGLTGVPRAGCPLVKVQETLDRLTSRGFSAVVCEEVPVMHRYGSRAPPKERYVAAIVTPASPQYVVGAADNGDDIEFDGAAPPPVVGVASTAVGYTLIAVEPDLRRVTVTEGLTSESAAAKLAAGGLAPPLYVHTSMDAGHAGRSTGVAGQTRRLRLEVGNILAAGTNDGDYGKQRYEGMDPVRGLLDLVRREYGMNVDQSFEFVGINGGREAATSKRPRPFPLTLATAQQLGVLPTRSVPPLLSHALPASSGAPAACRAYLQELLLHPPPRDTAAAISEACVLMSTGLSPSDGGVPRLEVVPPQKIAKLLWKKEATHVFFSEISAMASAVRRTLEHDAHAVRRAGELLLNPTALKAGRNVTKEGLVKACREAEEIIGAVVAEEVLDKGDWKPRAQVATSIDADADVDDDEYDEVDGETAADLEALALGLDAPPRVDHVPRQFLRVNEPWRGRVRRDRVEFALDACEAAARELADAIGRDLMPLIETANAEQQTRKVNRCHLEHDQRNNALWLRHLPAAVAKRVQAEGSTDLKHPVDRYGKQIGDRWTTPAVEDALNTYRVASFEAGKEVAGALRTLAADLEMSVADLVSAATFSAVATAASLHARHAVSRGWRPAELLPANDASTPWLLEGLVPFWMDRDDAVVNDVSLDGVSLLTGPNMAGKSTILRATAAAALLASCGLHCPVTSASVPFFDSLIVRMSSTDSPAEGLSSYAVEMAEVGQMLDVVTAKSAVFIDELGRGTEARHGTAMGGAVVEELDRSGARGIFATHLHGVLDLGLNLSPFAKRMMMETREDNDGRLRPTLRMVPGECRESLALQTATDMGVSDEVVHRSQELLAQIPETVVVCKTAPAAEEEASPTAAALAAAPPLESLRELLVSVGSLELGTVPEAGIVHAQDVPPPAARAWSCVYVLRRGDGWAYCGESDDLSGRLAAHRANAAREGSSDVECTFITVPREGGGKSRARALESRVIRKLRAEGIPLLSGSDARNTSFGSAA